MEWVSIVANYRLFLDKEEHILPTCDGTIFICRAHEIEFGADVSSFDVPMCCYGASSPFLPFLGSVGPWQYCHEILGPTPGLKNGVSLNNSPLFSFVRYLVGCYFFGEVAHTIKFHFA